ncbi:hypothetical protein SLEP1_g10761 [Rubroshorea leprosula]|uniref:Cytochrome P450 n=1 Tax=Rubroshorea leprosula TaxID=152421 RepID=A0AAV5IIZ8_9ROSI|nr:hypothetical protein SLEP1_g10761 [Rubroshorea leprosula]
MEDHIILYFISFSSAPPPPPPPSLQDGPVISLPFGPLLALLVSSASAIRECFTRNDVVSSDCRESLFSKYIVYNHTTIVTSSHNDHCGNLRRIASVEILSTSSLNKFLEIRKDDVKRMVAGKRYYDKNAADYEEARRFKELIAETAQIGAVGKPANVLPILKWIGNYEKRVRNIAKRMDGFLPGLVDERCNKKEENTMIDHLLSLQKSEPEYYTDEIIKGLVMTFILVGVDISEVTLEWAMSDLLNHPEVLNKAREEIDAQVGEERLIDEADVAKLHYLQKIMRKSLRLHPATPLLIPHMASADGTIGGYDDSFRPERFEKEEKERYKLLPFGLGRRACPWEGFPQRMVSLTLGSMIQCFQWKRMSEEKIDMIEGGGLTMPKAQPLEAMCKVQPMHCSQGFIRG